MERTHQLTCPVCTAGLTIKRGVRIGKKIICPRCGTAFTVRPEDAEKGRGVNAIRLWTAVAALVLYLAGGGSVALYCFSHNTGAHGEVRAAISKPGDAADEGDPGPAPALKVVAPPRGLSVSPARQREIDNAIAAGAWFLREHAQADGSWWTDSQVAHAALPGLTLLECGVPASEPVIQKAAALVRRLAINLENDNSGTYQLALAILFLDRLAAYEDEDLIRYLALCLIGGQDPDSGGWHYQCPALDRSKIGVMLQGLASDKQTLEDWRKNALQGRNFAHDGWDNSNTQFAILALWVAKRHQVAINKPIAEVEKHFRTTQMGTPSRAEMDDPDGNNVNLEGSWYYDRASDRGWRNSSRWPSMTCSGLLGLAIAHGVTKDPVGMKQKPLDDTAIQRGLAMLAREIDRPGEKRAPDLYYLWSLERVAVLYDLDAIVGKEWYTWGTKILLPRQRNDGSWGDGGYVGSNTILDTCLAVLFLKRANLAKDLTEKLQLLASLRAAPGQAMQPPQKKE